MDDMPCSLDLAIQTLYGPTVELARLNSLFSYSIAANRYGSRGVQLDYCKLRLGGAPYAFSCGVNQTTQSFSTFSIVLNSAEGSRPGLLLSALLMLLLKLIHAYSE
ncbi:hypothetical protein GUITHDRAFT_102960 [Guillardia theta CCMP2712]|uniref:Uncharacterized protein n=1 Tax=Guillardia theta (strain CCMP2712) TaxID=905079 RepID=L1JRF8_GUITC|nr:hypothetical protein GUITHDRAFT_102960 [Guillardia theta CCMP2712]EKX51037.1 hypothetical protein GUITHDRAFT_102960 [Guillardia theta CCMP2712]|eukprot:XP_005838017.1 hypothetical protein GUITHDRAFT_102960 [Guillardia theta CCMP2712]